MAVLIEGLPDEALCKQNPGDLPWDTTKELLALILEEVSIVAAPKYDRAEPVTFPRPYRDTTAAPTESFAGSPDSGMKATGLSGFLTAATVMGAVKSGE